MGARFLSVLGGRQGVRYDGGIVMFGVWWGGIAGSRVKPGVLSMTGHSNRFLTLIMCYEIGFMNGNLEESGDYLRNTLRKYRANSGCTTFINVSFAKSPKFTGCLP